MELFLAIRKVNIMFSCWFFFFFLEKAIYFIDLEKKKINFQTQFFDICTLFLFFSVENVYFFCC